MRYTIFYMKSRLKEKSEAISLRKQGFSYKEIMEQVDVSKSSLSGWFKHMELTDDENEALKKMAHENAYNGRARATVSNRERRMVREADAEAVARVTYETFKNDPNFKLGISLYWAEGGKRTSSFQFVNSDSSMVAFMVWWVQKYLGIQKSNIGIRLSTHADFKADKYEDYWSEALSIPLDQFRKTNYKPNRHGIYKKNPLYKGCARMEIGGGMALLRTVIGLQKILVEELKMLY